MGNSVSLGLTVDMFVDDNGKQSLQNRKKRIIGLESNRLRFCLFLGLSLSGYMMLDKLFNISRNSFLHILYKGELESYQL